jgi:hypothetical protein|tara:strand:- start:755 stop:1375 length:621 start_codon:yes stop_codon:yes gene_type:complete
MSRNLQYLNNNRIIYRRYSPDKPTEEYSWGWYYADGTYGYYSLFNSKAKINTIKSLKWHLLVLWYLNPDMDKQKFINLTEVITNKENEFVTFNVAPSVKKSIINDVYLEDLDRPPKNKLRKIVFKDGSGLSITQKLSIVGKLIGRKTMINEEAIYQCMLDLNDMGKKITIGRIAGLLDCSSRTIHRNMSAELKKEKDLLNIENEKI